MKAILALALVVVIAAACGGGSKAKPTVTPEATRTVIAETSPTAVVRHTGVADVDAIIDAVLSGDADRIRPLVQFQKIACIGPTPGNLGAFFCATGEPEGTVHEALQVGKCEGYWIAAEDSDTLSRIVSSDARVFAATRGPSPGDYSVVFAAEAGTPKHTLGSLLTIKNGQLVTVNFGCASTPVQFVANTPQEDFVLPPQ